VAINVFDIIKESIVQRKKRVLGELNILKRFKLNINRKSRVISGQVGQFVSALDNVLGQFSNKNGYSQSELVEKSTAAIEAGWSNTAGAEALNESGVNASTEEQQQAVQESLNDFQSSLINDPINAFSLARAIYDNATILNVRRAELVNELAETIGLVKLMRDAIPAQYYTNDSLSLLQASELQLTEIVRNLVLACNSISGGAEPESLVRTIENDLEVVVRYLAQESVYDASQFSPTEYLALTGRVRDAVEELREIDEQLDQIRFNVDNYQTNLLASYQNSFSACGNLETAKTTIEGVIERIVQLSLDTTENPNNQSIVSTRSFVLDLSVALTLLREFVQQGSKLEDVLNIDTSPERSSFEASQVALSSVPEFSSTLANNAEEFARRAERRLSSDTVDPRVDALFTSLSSDIPLEYTKSYDLQAGLNSFDLDLTAPSRNLFIQALGDLQDVGLDRAFDSLLLGDLSIGFDPLSDKASSVLYALQQAASAFERGAAGLASEFGACSISTRFGQAKVSQILADLQTKLQVQILSRVSFKDFVDKHINNLDNKVLKKLERALEEIDTLKVFEKCEN